MAYFMGALFGTTEMEKFFPDKKGSRGPDDPRSAGIFCMFLAIICLCCPFRTFLNR